MNGNRCWISFHERRNWPKSREGDITSSDDPHYIATEKKGSYVANELAEFYRLLDETKKEPITVGKRPFNPNLLLEPLKKFDDNELFEKYFGKWNDPRALFFVQKVLGYDGIQGCMPLNWVQAHQDWLDTTTEKLKNNQPQARGTSFKIFRSGNRVSVEFYPRLRRGIPEFQFMIYGCGQGGGRRCLLATGGFGISKLMSIKNSKHTEAYTAPTARPAV